MIRRTRIVTSKILASAAAQSHAAPTSATDGIDLSSWKQGGNGLYAFDAAALLLDEASGAIAIAAGAYIAGYIATLAAWFRIADLNGGAAIALTADVGFGQRVIDLGGFDRAAVVDAGDAGTHKYKLAPVEAQEG
jgi:hypothetical protein